MVQYELVRPKDLQVGQLINVSTVKCSVVSHTHVVTDVSKRDNGDLVIGMIDDDGFSDTIFFSHSELCFRDPKIRVLTDDGHEADT
jgi:hypothetical protein